MIEGYHYSFDIYAKDLDCLLDYKKINVIFCNSCNWSLNKTGYYRQIESNIFLQKTGDLSNCETWENVYMDKN